MWLDSTLPLTHEVPVHPVTGEVWWERFEQLIELATLYRYSGSDEDADRAGWKEEYDALREGVEFRSEPYVQESTLLLGAKAALPGVDRPPKIFNCHPDTWDALADDVKERFEVFDNDEHLLRES